MVKLACNYLREAEELLREGKVEFDYFKYPSLGKDDSFYSLNVFFDRLKYIKSIKPLIYHGIYPNNINICNKNFINYFDIEAFREVCNITKTPGISFHLNGADMSDSKDEVIRNSIKNILFIKENFANMEFITFENAMGNCNQYELNAEVISEIINKTDSDFLYDISHAYWSAVKLGETFESYASKLPLDRSYEIHINGWQEQNGDIQGHMKIQEELYGYLEDIVFNYPVQIVTLEYGRHHDRIGTGCPLVDMDKVNLRAKEEVEEQLLKLIQIIK